MIKQLKDHVIIKSPFCGEIHEILAGREYSPNIAIAFDIGPTKAHYHNGFDEIYFVVGGSITLKLYNPSNAQTTVHLLAENELCVITVPEFDLNDEVISNHL